MTKYFINFFHGLIIAGFILSFSGCGYKDDPKYIQQEISSNQNNSETSQQ
jgi:hypothetical protein